MGLKLGGGGAYKWGGDLYPGGAYNRKYLFVYRYIGLKLGGGGAYKGGEWLISGGAYNRKYLFVNGYMGLTYKCGGMLISLYYKRYDGS